MIAAVARAEPGGVVFHCAGGRDRAGQIAMLVLAVVGVAPEDIADDYELSADRLRARHAARSEEDEGALLDAFLAAQGTSARQVILGTLAELDVEAHLRAGGLTDGDLAALRARFLA